MSDASEVKRFIHWFGPDYDGSAQFSQEVVLASDFDRIMAERDELWKRATKFVMPGEMDTGESIEHYIKTLEQTIARQAKAIEKLRISMATALELESCGETSCPIPMRAMCSTPSHKELRKTLLEITAIEQGEGT